MPDPAQGEPIGPRDGDDPGAPETRLQEAIKQVEIAAGQVQGSGLRPELKNCELQLRGALAMLEDQPDYGDDRDDPPEVEL